MHAGPFGFIQLWEMVFRVLQALYAAAQDLKNMKFKTAPVVGSAAETSDRPCAFSTCAPGQRVGSNCPPGGNATRVIFRHSIVPENLNKRIVSEGCIARLSPELANRRRLVEIVGSSTSHRGAQNLAMQRFGNALG